jgi:hypothetical protein
MKVLAMRRRVTAAVPARDISAARVVGDPLLIGISGYGALACVSLPESRWRGWKPGGSRADRRSRAPLLPCCLGF